MTKPTSEALSEMEKAWERSRKRVVPDNPTRPAPGIYANMPFEDYCRIDAINNSSLKGLRTSPMHYRYSPPIDETPALRLGTFVHHGKLEPELLDSHYIVVPEERFAAEVLEERPEIKAPKSTKDFRAKVANFLKLHPGKQPMSDADFEKLAAILKQLRVHRRCKRLFADGVAEITIIWEEQIELPDLGTVDFYCKGRIDWYTESHSRRTRRNGPKLRTASSVDLKTTQDIFWFDLGTFEYHRQAAFYLRGWELAHAQMQDRKEAKRWASHLSSHHIAVVETKRPYAVRCAPVSRRALDVGAREAQWCLETIAACTLNRRWPGPDDPEAWSLSPNYYPLNSRLPLSALSEHPSDESD